MAEVRVRLPLGALATVPNGKSLQTLLDGERQIGTLERVGSIPTRASSSKHWPCSSMLLRLARFATKQENLARRLDRCRGKIQISSIQAAVRKQERQTILDNQKRSEHRK